MSGIRPGCFLLTTAIYVAKHCVHSSMFVTVLHQALFGLAWSSLGVHFESPNLSGNSLAISMNSPVAIWVTNFAGIAGNPASMYIPSSLPENVAGGMGWLTYL